MKQLDTIFSVPDKKTDNYSVTATAPAGGLNASDVPPWCGGTLAYILAKLLSNKIDQPKTRADHDEQARDA